MACLITMGQRERENGLKLSRMRHSYTRAILATRYNACSLLIPTSGPRAHRACILRSSCLRTPVQPLPKNSGADKLRLEVSVLKNGSLQSLYLRASALSCTLFNMLTLKHMLKRSRPCRYVSPIGWRGTIAHS